MTETLPAESPITLRDLVLPGVAAIRQYWRPFLLIQLVALLLVVGYYQWDAMRRACEVIARTKQQWGYLFSGVAGALSAGILPEIFKAIALGDWKVDGNRLRSIRFNLVFFAMMSIYVDAFYRLNGVIFGNDPSTWTAIKKMLLDQLIFTPFFTTPVNALAFEWKSSSAPLFSHIRAINGRWFLLRGVVLLLPCWAFWVPAVLLVYLLPNTLQFSLFALENAAWSILMIAVAARK